MKHILAQNETFEIQTSTGGILAVPNVQNGLSSEFATFDSISSVLDSKTFIKNKSTVVSAMIDGNAAISKEHGIAIVNFLEGFSISSISASYSAPQGGESIELYGPITSTREIRLAFWVPYEYKDKTDFDVDSLCWYASAPRGNTYPIELQFASSINYDITMWNASPVLQLVDGTQTGDTPTIVKQIAGQTVKTIATIDETKLSTSYSDWKVYSHNYHVLSSTTIEWSDESIGWCPYAPNGLSIGTPKGQLSSTSLVWEAGVDGTFDISAARAVSSYILGDQTSKPLAPAKQHIPVYDGQNMMYMTASDVNSPIYQFNTVGSHKWTAYRPCIVYVRIQGSASGPTAYLHVNDCPNYSIEPAYEAENYRICIASVSTTSVVVPVWLNAGDDLWFTLTSSSAISGMTLQYSVFYID